jgi:PAS domain-containing protein
MTVRLDQFIINHLEPILREFENFAKTILTTKHISLTDLQSDAKQILINIAQDMTTAQSRVEQIEKSKGLPQKIEHNAAWTHGYTRLQQGFDINQVVSEYRALRASVTKLWQDNATELNTSHFNDIVRFNEAIDQVLCTSLASYIDALKKQNALFNSMLSSYPDLCYILNLKGELIYINQAMRNLYQKGTYDILGKTVDHPALPTAVDIQAHIQSIIKTGKNCHGDLIFKKPSEEDAFFEYIYAPIIDEAETLVAISAIQHDVTRIKKNEHKFKHLLEAVPDAIVICD